MSPVAEWDKECPCHSILGEHLGYPKVQRMSVVPACSYQRLWHDHLSLNRRVANHCRANLRGLAHDRLAQPFAQHQQSLENQEDTGRTSAESRLDEAVQ